MNTLELLNRLQKQEVTFSLIGDQVKLSSKGKVSQLDLDHLKANRDEAINLIKADHLARAIDEIEAVYSPVIESGFSEEDRHQKSALDSITFTTITDVNRWRDGWLKLILRKRGVENVR